MDITGNSYPYETGWSYVRQTLPTWALEGNSADIVARLQKPDTRARILAEMKKSIAISPTPRSPRPIWRLTARP